MKPLWRILAVVLAATAAVGCIPVPGNDRPVEGGLRPEEKIGPTDESPIRLNRSTRENVISVLGEPAWLTLDGRTLGYTYHVNGWTWVWVVPFTLFATPDWEDRVLRLEFDPAGTLVSFKVTKDRTFLYRGLGQGRFVMYSHYQKQRGAAPNEIVLPPLGQ